MANKKTADQLLEMVGAARMRAHIVLDRKIKYSPIAASIVGDIDRLAEAIEMIGAVVHEWIESTKEGVNQAKGIQNKKP